MKANDTERLRMGKIDQSILDKHAKRIQKLRPIDDDFMRCIFQDNLPLAQDVLRTITGISTLVLEKQETQRDIKNPYGKRSIILDVWGYDKQGKIYDLEVQRADEGANPKRARFYSAAIDTSTLKAGEDFARLPETFVIFITENDFFGQGEAIYRIERSNLETKELFGDEAHIYYVNARYNGDDELGDLMHDFLCSDPEEMRTERLKERADYLKHNPKGVAAMCQLLEEMCEEARAEGVEQGI